MKTVTSLQPRQLLLTAIAPLAAAILMALPASSMAGVELVVNFAPPPIPVYEQPSMPGDGYLWTPGYWAYSDDDYFWVPGTWVRPPRIGVLWTPGYWAYDGGRFAFRDGYWGEHIGFYGGVNYGYGYGGRGYEGGYWNQGAFFYNRNVNSMGSIQVRNVYERTVVNNVTINRISYNGGPGGVQININNDEQRAQHEQHVQAVADQHRQVEMASQNKELRAKVNNGAPAIAATPKAGVFQGAGVVHANAAAAGEKTAEKPRAEAPAGANATAEQEAAKSREAAQAKANASGAPERDAAKPRAETAATEPKPQEGQPKSEPKPAVSSAPVGNAQHRHTTAPRVANQTPRDSAARPMPADRMDRVPNGNRADAPRTAARPDRPVHNDRPATQPPPRVAKPQHQPPASNREDGKDGKKEQ